MQHLYTPALLRSWRLRARRTLIALLAGSLTALGVCIALCTMVRTGNADKLLAAVAILSTLTGWAVMLCITFLLAPARAEAEHIGGILSGEAAQAEGVLTVDSQRWLIPRSIAFYKATLRTPEETVTLNVNARLAARLPGPGARVRVLTVRKFITAFEVQDA